MYMHMKVMIYESSNAALQEGDHFAYNHVIAILSFD